MAARQEVLKACADWRTLREVQEATGLSIGYLRSLRAEYLEGGYLEERFEDGRGFEYRAVAGAEPRRRDAHVQGAVLGVLGDSPKTIREIVAETGCARISVYQALGGLVRKG